MIAASDPLEFAPGGRQTVLRHPGSLISQLVANNQAAPGDSVLLQKFREVNISEKPSKEFWIVRDDGVNGEEELYCSGKVAIHSKGNQSTRVLQKSYTCEHDIKHALWCSFRTYTLEQLSKSKDLNDDDNSAGKTIDCICLLDTYTLKVFTETGEDYVSSLQFQVSAVWPTKFGLLLEKSEVSTSSSSRYTSLEMSRALSNSDSHLPVAFSLMHPLDEICPLLIKHGSISYMCDSSQKIVFTSSEPSLAVIYDTKTGLHSVYKIRKATPEECQIICGSNDTTPSLFNYSTSSPKNIGSNASLNKSITGKALSLFGMPNPPLSALGMGLTNSPFGSRTTSYTTTSGSGQSPAQQQQMHSHSRSQSPMATISRCQSPTHSGFSPLSGVPPGTNIHQTRLHQTMFTNILGHSQNSPCGSYNSMQFQDIGTTPSKPVYPEICLDHVWTESNTVSKDVIADKGTKVFLTTDLVGQSYLGYLVPNRSQLFLVRLEKTNKQQQIIFGMVTTIIAKDAINLPKLNMVAIMDMSNGITLYSGTTLVGKVHIPSILPSLTGFNQFVKKPMPLRRQVSPFPRRSSLLSPSCASSHDIKFEEGLHLLSPVGFCGQPSNLLETSLIDENLVALKDSLGNKLTLEYGNQNYFRITLPLSSTSPLVTKCLQTLKSVLQRDLAMQLLVKWYGARNAPGPQNFSPKQEWHLFLVILFTLLGYEVDKLPLIQTTEANYLTETNNSGVLSKKQKTNECGSLEDWAYTADMSVYESTQIFVSNILGLTKFSKSSKDDFVIDSAGSNGKINTQASLFPYLPLVLFSLHLLYEELKLNCLMTESLPLLAQLLSQMSKDLKFDHYLHHYFLDYPKQCKINFVSQITDVDLQKITPPNYMSMKPSSIFETLNNLMNFENVTPFPYLKHVNTKTRNIIQLFALIANENRVNQLDMERYIKVIVPAGSRVDSQDIEFIPRDVPKRFEQPIAERILLLYHELGMRKKDLETLPPGVAVILKDVMHRCREEPLSNWPADIYELVDRQDLAGLEKHSLPEKQTDHLENGKNYAIKDDDPDQDDGMDFDDTILKLRFNKDHRVAELRKLLNSSKPVKISVVQRPVVSDHDFIEEQERHLLVLSTRTMALPVARGMFTLRTATPIITEQLPIPRLCLTGKAPPRGTTVELSHIEVPPNMNLWPLFHNGVAAGLRIHPDASNIDSTWIVYNKQQQGEFGVEHSGFLMALGLNGHLKNLAPVSMYEYLVECHEATSVGLLLGLSATHRGTMDVSMTKLLSLHVETLLPPTSIELSVQQNVQVAALMGVGLVYQGTAHRHIAHALLSEIGRPPGPEMKNCVDRESYSLAAGLALGLVVLECGGACDIGNIPDTLHYYMVGGNVRPFMGAQKDKYKSPSYQIREGDSINIDVTSPGATIALGLMYFNSGNRAVAEWMRAPDTQYLLDFVRPDLLMLRILSRALILWNEIEPTKTWVSSHVPEIVQKYKLIKPSPEITEAVDLETMNQAYCNIIAGACMALGLKYAGTANDTAFKTLQSYADLFISLSHKPIAELAGKFTIETCLNVVILASSVVMAGTGNLEVMRMCRYIRTRVGPTNNVVTYGSHLSTHMALGFLFLGGGRYTLSNSPSAVAALIIALFPKFPTHSNDNRYHLQALRHLYVLAAEPRLLLPRDIDNSQYCYASVTLTFQTEKMSEGQEIIMKAPCLLPQMNSLKKVQLNDDRYWKISFERCQNWTQLEDMLSRCEPLDVKQRAGCLSYLEDPRGFRSLMARTLTTENVIAWAAQSEHITSFSNDKTILNIVKYFLDGTTRQKFQEEILHDICPSKNQIKTPRKINDSMDRTDSIREQSSFVNDRMEIGETSFSEKIQESFNDIELKQILEEMSESERHFLQIFPIITYECVIKDKVSFLPLWVNLYKTIEEIKRRPSSYLVWQIKLVGSRILCENYSETSNRLLTLESILAIKQKTAMIMDLWEDELVPLIRQYLINGTVQAEPEKLAKLTTYLVFYDILHQIDLKAISDPLAANKLSSNTSIISLFKLHQLLQL
ncbi:anaphase-promoting complex subunit 1 [Leptopilina heterotoma]|uniref:anaphase-promoting complex subunit 1 n=1 Tax=Leptopilina heterotoma TaxID=63436 RepID=UPI001CA840B0|nr:anaphase-promoting complex subunit 1 [Leptopilina heterotoma]